MRFSQIILTAPPLREPLALCIPGYRGRPAPGAGRCLSLVTRSHRTATTAVDADNDNAASHDRSLP